ncbi:MAG: metallophosphoesterase [bacterium]
MPRWLLFIVFFAIAFSIVGGLHFYIYRRLVVTPMLPAPWATIVRVALVVAAASIPLSFVAARLLSNQAARYVVFPIYVWMGFMMMFFFVLLGLDVLRGLVWGVAKATGHAELLTDPERRRLLGRAVAGLATGTVLTAAGYALAHGLGKLVVKRVEILLPHLPRELDGFTIVQLTDLHLGPMRQRDWMADVVTRVNALKPDLVAVTGDLVDGTVGQLAADVAPLQGLKPPHGVFFVTGNHEYFVDLPGWLKHLPSIGLRVLRNERVTIKRGSASFDLVGIDDHEGRRLARGHGADVPKAMQGVAPKRAVVMLAHQPKAVLEACEHDVGLVLSGHTHGGQIWPWRYFVYLQQPYVRGLHNHRGTQLYVSDGTGFWGPPMRLGSTAEITHVTLRSPRG